MLLQEICCEVWHRSPGARARLWSSDEGNVVDDGDVLLGRAAMPLGCLLASQVRQKFEAAGCSHLDYWSNASAG